jgi:hypothetical protein
MFINTLLIAVLAGIARATTGETVTNSNIAVYTTNINDGIGGGTDSYTFYSGDGSTGAGWPSKSKWLVLALSPRVETNMLILLI